MSHFVHAVTTIPIYCCTPDIEEHNAELFGCLHASDI
jgi:hypothetical protein